MNEASKRHAIAWATAGLLLAACGGGGGGGGGGGDSKPPSVALTAPANFADGLTGTLDLRADAADDVAVAGVEFQVDGVIVGSEDASAPYTASVDTSLYAAGQHVVRARARDTSGKLSTWASATVRFGGSASVPQGFTKNDAWVPALNSATAFAQAPDGRLFVCEQGGALRVVKNGVLLGTPFMTLSVDSSGERGLLGVAIDPNFAVNHWVYVYYTTTVGGAHNRISRFTANGDVVSVGSESVIADLPALSVATNHNGGAIHFGIDGMLYVGVGDNADGTQAPDLSNPKGKLLRFNPDGSNGWIPTDNPFCTTSGQLQCAIWARGLRNPFTFAVEPGTGRIFINDVGQSTWEEIDVGAAGANYGWPASEGPDNITSGVTAPLFAYNHNPASPPGSGPGGFFTGIAITGGTFYRGSYFFADLGSMWVAQLDLANGNAAYAFAQLADSPVDMLAGADGALYVLTRSAITRISTP